ncbi:laccase domain-containing protein, partial [Methylomagnum sp.]
MTTRWIEPDWPAPSGVRAASTLRGGGVSAGPYAGLNLGAHVGDDPAHVEANRRRLAAALNLPAEPVWLIQVHGRRTVRAEAPGDRVADAAYTRESGVVCAVMTADCLPVLLCSRDGEAIAAAHAGWKGLAGGVIESAVDALGGRDTLAWLGPAIGPEAFEVGGEVRAAFLANGAEFANG